METRHTAATYRTDDEYYALCVMTNAFFVVVIFHVAKYFVEKETHTHIRFLKLR